MKKEKRKACSIKENLYNGVTDLVERMITAKRERDGAINMDDYPERQGQWQGSSGPGQLSAARAEEEAGDDRSLALAEEKT